MDKFKITIVGNSIAFRIRPQIEGSKNYGQYIEQTLNERYPHRHNTVENTAFSRATVTDIQAILHSSILQEHADVFIINLGVCDASTREIPFWYAEIINRKKDGLLKFVFQNFHNVFFKKNRRFFVKLRGKRTWISQDKFAKIYTQIITEIQRAHKSKIITLSINAADDRVESILPGSRAKYIIYNKIIHDISKKHQAVYLPLDDLESSVHFPDGSHFSDLGHKIVAERIMQLLYTDNS